MGSSRFRQIRPSIEAATLATTRLLSATLKCLDAAKAMAADVLTRFPADSRRSTPQACRRCLEEVIERSRACCQRLFTDVSQIVHTCSSSDWLHVSSGSDVICGSPMTHTETDKREPASCCCAGTFHSTRDLLPSVACSGRRTVNRSPPGGTTAACDWYFIC